MIEIKNISNKEKIAQLIFPKLNIDEFDSKFEYYKKLVEIGVGGFCLFGVEADIIKIREVITNLQSIAKIPLLFCADMEHGLNMRFNAGTSMPRAEAVGNTLNPKNAGVIGEMIAREALSCGILWNLAPVADINSNPDNPIVFLRSYGDSAKLVTAMTNNYIIGTQSMNVLSCVKHFPGHGDTNVDSHVSVPIINKSLNELAEIELVPFYTAIKAGVTSIMVGHLIVPAMDDTNCPASISKPIITKILKEKLAYKGLIVTDALDMQSLHKDYNPDELAFLAFRAGADVMLMPLDSINSYNYLIDNLDDTYKERIEESFNKIISAKQFTKLFEEPTYPAYDKELHFDTSMDIATQALSFTGDNSFLPLKEDDTFLYIGVLIGEQELSIQAQCSSVLGKMTLNDCDTVFVNEHLSESDAEYLSDEAENNQLVIISVIQAPQAYRQREKLSESLKAKINKIAQKSKSVCISFGSKELTDGIKTDFYISTASDSYTSFTSACAVITGSSSFFNYVSEVSKLNTN